MQDDKQKLEDLNREIGKKESTGDQESRAWLANVIAPELAFLRANGTIVDRDGFLKAVKRSAPRENEVESIDLYGNRAIVKSIVTMDGQKYHNLRLFIKQGEDWKLLGWANERLTDD